MKRPNLAYALTFFVFFLSLLAVSPLSSFVLAQSTDDLEGLSIPSLIPGFEEQIGVNVEPENPAPNQNVSISLEAYGTDLDRANISWLLNGKVIKNGIGARTFDFTAGKMGSLSRIEIIILPITGVKITKEVSISPASVDIVWEATDSFVPPFYKGKALYPPEGNLIFVALPNLVRNGVAIEPKTLVYKWTENGVVVGNRSGYGKNTFSFTGDLLNQPITIEVEASSVNDNITGVGSISLSSFNPGLLLYEDSPLFGLLFNKGLGEQYDLLNDEVGLTVFPYYFSTPTPNSLNISYRWSINNSPLVLSKRSNNVVFRKPEGAEGQSFLFVHAENPLLFLQSADNATVINFSNKRSDVPF